MLVTVQDGNTCDGMWNSQIIDEIQQSFLDPQKVSYVADSALIMPTNLDKMGQHKMRIISRLPKTYHLALELRLDRRRIKIRQELNVRQQFWVRGNSFTDHPTVASIFDIMQTALVG